MGSKLSLSQNKKRITQYYPPSAPSRSKVNSLSIDQKLDDYGLEPEEIILSSRQAFNFIESSLRESKTFENYLEDNVATYEEHFEESKDGEKTSLIKTINSPDSGYVEQANSPKNSNN